MAEAFAQKLGPDLAEDKVGSALIGVVQSIIFRQVMPKLQAADADENGEGGEGEKDSFEDLMHLASAVQKLSSAQKTDADRVLKIRQTVLAQAAAVVVSEGKSRGLNAETVAEIRAKVLGVKA